MTTRTKWIVGVLLAVFVGLGIGIAPYVVTSRILEAVEQSAAASTQADRNAAVLRIILAVTGCTLEDTPEQCQGRLAERSKVEGIARVYEVDCRTRRALAGLPAQPPTEKCVMPTTTVP